jgi:hypothetical protein
MTSQVRIKTLSRLNAMQHIMFPFIKPPSKEFSEHWTKIYILMPSVMCENGTFLMLHLILES